MNFSQIYLFILITKHHEERAFCTLNGVMGEADDSVDWDFGNGTKPIELATAPAAANISAKAAAPAAAKATAKTAAPAANVAVGACAAHRICQYRTVNTFW